MEYKSSKSQLRFRQQSRRPSQTLYQTPRRSVTRINYRQCCFLAITRQGNYSITRTSKELKFIVTIIHDKIARTKQSSTYIKHGHLYFIVWHKCTYANRIIGSIKMPRFCTKPTICFVFGIQICQNVDSQRCSRRIYHCVALRRQIFNKYTVNSQLRTALLHDEAKSISRLLCHSKHRYKKYYNNNK